MHRFIHAFPLKCHGRSIIRKTVSVAAVLGLLLGTIPVSAGALTTYIIKDGNATFTLASESSNIEKVLENAGFQLNASDTLDVEESDGRCCITICRSHQVSIYADGQMICMNAPYGNTVQDCLDAQGIELNTGDQISCDPGMEVTDGLKIIVTRYQTDVSVSETVTPYDTIVYEDSSMDPGTEAVLVDGQDCIEETTTTTVYRNGVEISTETTTVVTQEMITEVIVRGPERTVTEQDASLATYVEYTLENGETDTDSATAYLHASKVLTMTATAYTTYVDSGLTYCETIPCLGTVAVDPNVIPLGTKMYIVSADHTFVYGYCTALDTGSAIKGNIVDLYMDTRAECIQFGRQKVLVYILD